MASERDIELLDDYLSNRLSEPGRKSFEERLNSDPELRQQFEQQQYIVHGIRHARATELKAMLNNITVSAAGAEPSSTAIKLITTLFAAGLTATVLYFYAEHRNEEVQSAAESIQESVQEVIPPAETRSTQDSAYGQQGSELLKNDETSTEKPANSATTPGQSVTPTMEAVLQKERELIAVVSRTFVTSSTEVVTERGDDHYTFHYAFRDKRLVLFGAFRKNEYQILEFITDKDHIFFLDYNQNYYLLDENTSTPTPLTPIQDPGLRQKLREFRAN